jgi:hypothetical protein
VTAAGVAWQIQGEPLAFAGSLYYPTGPDVFFDGAVMVRIGTYEGVPLYVDATLEPYSVVYVPIRGLTMRPYERRREGSLAGTTGSRAPSFPIERDGERDVDATNGPASSDVEPPVETDAQNVVEPRAFFRMPISAAAATAPTRPNIVQSYPAAASNAGIWIAYDGARWFLRGDAQPLDPARFVVVGEYRGFHVYRERSGSQDDIYVPSVAGGPLTHYRR